VRFVWLVCGDNSWNPKYFEETKNKFRDIEEVYFVGYKKDITIGLGMADYLVQLSDFEGCPLSIFEALKMGVPCIVTGWGGVNELVQDGVNGYILDMQLSDLDKKLDLIVNKIPKFEYKPLSSVEDWTDLIGEVKDSKKRKIKGAKVLITKNYFDIVLRKKIKQGAIREVDVERAKQLANAGVGEIIEMSKLR
jgi:glycosyltransferase involved in cell wall biosynthesis